ncbi:universal stress protein [Halorarum halophilum]|uniref:Universal stress protein n=1 Tax=Halorarum halophilum TaxID=2743090 RepID=A0A7D5GEL7_9EURY|nr:universal stress protein [Halobaculum halophilum]QLG27488.1 universal stress protein [Halobaculum halophilum]
MYDDILVPTDGSAAADAAVEHAVTLAERFDATLHALYVVDSTAYSSLEAGSQMVAEALEDEGEAAVDRIAAAANDADLPVVESVVSGTAYRSILEYAGEEDIDLITMGTHGRRGIDRYLLGSVTERVVRSADQPVLTVRYHKDEAE